MKAKVLLSAILLAWSVGLFAQEEIRPERPPGRVISGISTVVPPKPVVRVQSVSLDSRQITLTENGCTHKLTATVTPANADNRGINWRSHSNGAVAKVADGVVSPVAVGTDTIFAVSQFDATKIAFCLVEVKMDSLAVYRAQYQTLNAQLQANDGQVISLQDGKITYAQAHKKALFPNFLFYILAFLLLLLLLFLFLLNRNKNKQIADLEEVKKHLKMQCSMLEKEKSALITDKKNLSDEVDRLQNTNTELRGEIFSIQEQVKNFEEIIARFEEKKTR